ncbi:MAG: hypothetical protein IKU25_01870 [Clostridia bacterium]|nr:hypothetical protein [Clostridia bacterium]
MDKKENTKNPSALEVAESFRKKSDIVSDVLGSYTGTSETDDIPEQDADDL